MLNKLPPSGAGCWCLFALATDSPSWISAIGKVNTLPGPSTLHSASASGQFLAPSWQHFPTQSEMFKWKDLRWYLAWIQLFSQLRAALLRAALLAAMLKRKDYNCRAHSFEAFETLLLSLAFWLLKKQGLLKLRLFSPGFARWPQPLALSLLLAERTLGSIAFQSAL